MTHDDKIHILWISWRDLWVISRQPKDETYGAPEGLNHAYIGNIYFNSFHDLRHAEMHCIS